MPQEAQACFEATAAVTACAVRVSIKTHYVTDSVTHALMLMQGLERTKTWLGCYWAQLAFDTLPTNVTTNENLCLSPRLACFVTI